MENGKNRGKGKDEIGFIECPFPKRYPSELHRDDAYFMSFAYNQAIEAWNKDEVPVGAVVEYQGNIIASAYNQVEVLNDPTAHAEMLVLTQAAEAIEDWRLNDVTLYVTKEPCPMCSGAMIMSRVGRVVFAFSDPKMGGLGGAYDLNEIETLNHHVLVTKGVLELECKELVQAYFQKKREKG